MIMLGLLAGCKHKQNAAPPPQAQAPTVAPETQPATPPTNESATPPAETPPKEPETTTPAESTSAAKPTTPKPRPKRPVLSHKPAPQPAQTPAGTQQSSSQAQAPSQQASNHAAPAGAGNAPAQPATGASPEPSTASPAPAIPDDQTLHARGTTDQLLQATEGNLRRLNRSLNPAEQKMVDEIKNYMQRARSAQTDGDLNLAHNYALKAHQLSDALVAQ